MANEMKEALDSLIKDKSLDREQLLAAVQTALESACRNYFNRDKKNIPIDLKVITDFDTGEYNIFLGKEVIADEDDIITELTEIKQSDARKFDENAEIGDIVYVLIPNVNFGHIITQNAIGIITQKIRELEKNSIFNEYKAKEGKVLQGNIRKIFKEGYSVNLGSVDGTLMQQECLPNEKFDMDDKVVVYVLKVEESPKFPKITLTRVGTDIVIKLFEKEVQELRDGIVTVKAIVREPGIRTKMAVLSSDENIDPVGSCLGVNSIRVNVVVDTLDGEKIDVLKYDEDISNYIENAISPAKSVATVIDESTRSSLVIVPDTQLSLAIGKDGQNARMAAKLTGYKIDIKSESQAIESGLADELGLEYDRSKYTEDRKLKDEYKTEEQIEMEIRQKEIDREKALKKENAKSKDTKIDED